MATQIPLDARRANLRLRSRGILPRFARFHPAGKVARLIPVLSLLVALGSSGIGCSHAPAGSVAKQGSPTYTVTDLGPIAFDLSYSINRYICINDQGQIATTYSPAQGVMRSCTWRSGQRAELPTLPGYHNSRTLSINLSGDIAGYGFSPTGHDNPTCPFLYSNKDIRGLVPANNPTPYIAVAVNNDKDVLLRTRTDSYLYQQGKLRDLKLAGAIMLNDTDQVIGTGPYGPGRQVCAFLYHAGNLQGLGTLPGGIRSTAEDINNEGQIVGYAGVNNRSRAFFWQNGHMTDLGAQCQLDDSVALCINKEGQIVGFAGGPEVFGSDARAFLWQNGVAQNLNDLIPTGSGWLLISAGAINDRGQIAGFGYYKGKQQAFLLTPISASPKTQAAATKGPNSPGSSQPV